MVVTVNADGGSRGNPGKAAIGIVIREGTRIKEVYKEYIGKTTNNVAEYMALIKALELALKYTDKDIEVIMDSELVIKQMLGKYKVKTEHLIPLYRKARELEGKFKKISYNNVLRDDEYQTKADKLVNDALDE